VDLIGRLSNEVTRELIHKLWQDPPPLAVSSIVADA
jgi:hypothetical protein